MANQSIDDHLRIITEQLAQMNQDIKQSEARLGSRFDQVETRLGILEEAREPHTESDHETPPHPRRAQQPDLYIRPNPMRPLRPDPVLDVLPRRPNHEAVDQEERALRSVRLEAPTFDGSMDPKDYLDWEEGMDQYFDWYDMSEERKFKFAKLKLVRQARLYWATLERRQLLEGRDPIVTWHAMKARLRSNYVPTSYEQSLLDQWQGLIQGSKTVNEYIATFQEYTMRCNIVQSEEVTLSKFRYGLRADIQRELYLRRVHDLEEAYQVARDYEERATLS